ncbi:MAG: ornithine carbamoyltransferase, partial [Thermoplasmata archaeon]|nr:ornithine carbamoyltransferase [Thermoplasmata archaeon]
MKKDLISINDLTVDEVKELFDLARELKSGKCEKRVDGRTLALIFEKPS